MSHLEPSDTTKDGFPQFPQHRRGSVRMRAQQLEGSLVLQTPSTAPSSNPHLRSYASGTLQRVAGNRTPPPVSPKPKTDKQRRELLTQSCIEPLRGSPVTAGAYGSSQSPPSNPLKVSATTPQLLAGVTEPNLSLKAGKVGSDKEKLPPTQSTGKNESPLRTNASLQRPPKPPPTKPKPPKRTDNRKKASLASIAGKGIRKLFHNINPRDLMLKLLGTTKEGTEQENLDVEDELQLPKVLADEIENSKEFQPIVDLILKRLLDFNDSVHFEEPDVLKQTSLQLHEKKVLISAFGCHNTGKSTLLNALLGNRLLPVSQMNETSVTVEIQHDGSVHQGSCTASGGACKKCPFLVETRKSSADDTSRSVTDKQSGVSNICNTIQNINKTVRETTKLGAGTEYTVHTNLPMIQAPPSWTVHLVDNAGFGEAGQEGIIKQATTALVTSSAYVYIMSYENLGDRKDVAAFQRIYDKDRGVFTDRRLLVVVTHFDVSYTQEMEDQVLSPDVVREEVYKVVKAATEGNFSLTKDDVVLVSGMWAFAARKLLYTHDDDPNLMRKVRMYLVDFGKNPSTGTSAQDLARQLEEASGITSVEQRIKEMASACLRIWVENIKKSCSLYLTRACHAFEGASRSCEEYNEANITPKYEEKDKNYKKLKAAQKKLEQSKSGKDSDIYKQLETAYQKDTQKESLLSEALQTADDAIKEFSTSCKKKCASNYKPTDFASDVDNFLEETSKELVEELSKCNFESVSSCFATQREDIGEKATQLMAAVERFCATDKVNFTPQSTSQKSLSDVLKTDEIPSCLKDLNIKLPTLTGFEKAKRWLRNLFLKESAGLREEEIDDTMNELKTELENGCKSYLTKVQPDVLEFYYGQYTVRVESVLEIFNRDCSFHIEQQEQAMKKMHEELMSNKKEIETMQQWHAYLEKLHNKLYRSAEEYLKHENAAFQGHDPSALPDPVSEERDDAVTAHSDAGFLTVYFHQHRTKVPTQAGHSVLNILEQPAKEWGIRLVPGSYILYTDDRESEVDWSTDSTAFSGCNVYIEHKVTTTELETGERPPSNRRTRSRSFSEAVDAVSQPEISDETLPAETVDGPSNDRQTRSRGWTTDGLLDSEMGHKKLPNETVESPSENTPTQPRPLSETVDGVLHLEMENEALPGESPQHIQSKQRNSSKRRKRKDWWNRLQRGHSPEPTCEPEAQKVAKFEDDFKEDLLSICEAAKNRLEQLQTELPKSHVLNLVTAELVHLWKQAEEREILVAVLGYYNSGKSSLLNALAGDKVLPVSITHETEMKVKLQYDGKLHKGCCKKDSFDELPPSFCESCPVLFEGEGVEVCKGASAIVSHLQQVHRSLRQNPEKNAEEYAIHVNIPILNCIPSPWQLCLVDNPSFKELTEIGMQEEFQDEVMALSAYIYTAPYKQLIDTVDANAFKLISEKDQAKAAFLEERLVIAVTHFDAYYAALEVNEKANVEHVKELVCMTIKKATSRDFPLESVVPVCSQWAFIAKQLLCQPQNKNLLQKALRCLEVCPDEYMEGISKDDVHPLVVAKKLEAASGIKQLELRIMELARKACEESKYRITNVFSGYLKAAVKNLSHIIDEPEQTATGRRRSITFVSDQARINFLKGELEKHTKQEDSPAYQSLRSQCSAEFEDLSRKMEDECKVLVQSFQEKCATKIATREEAIFSSTELEKDIAEFIKNAYEHLQALLSSETFQQSIKACYDGISEVDELFTKMLRLAQNLHHDSTEDNMPQTAGKHLDVEPWLSALKKLPLLQLDKLKKEVDIPRSTGRILRRTRSYSRQDQLHGVIKQLESCLLQWLKTALQEVQAPIIKLLFGHLSNYAKEGLKTFTDKFEDTPMESDEAEKLQRLRSWQKHLQDLQKHLEKKSEEDLAAKKELEEVLTSYTSP